MKLVSRFGCLVFLTLGWLTLPALVHAEDKPFKDPDTCLGCHDDLLEEKVIHQAIKDGCLDCHSNLDASKRPHKNTGDFPHGLDAEQPKLCLGCHGKLIGKKPVVHKAINDKGCTACHEPHSGANKRMLKAVGAKLCNECHKPDKFTGPVVHKPVAEGKCQGCHNPHASDTPGLLLKKAADTCLECHKKVSEGPHMITGFSRKSHPIGLDVKPIPDPLRPGKDFYCVSCHEPHRGQFAKLARIDPKLGMEACQKCHDK